MPLLTIAIALVVVIGLLFIWGGLSVSAEEERETERIEAELRAAGED